MFEKVNPYHPDKICDRIAGAIVDLAYEAEDNPKIAVEVLLGHGNCTVIAETSVSFYYGEIYDVVRRIAGENIALTYIESPQDRHLAQNQRGKFRCGDNGIFRGTVETDEQRELTQIAKTLTKDIPSDGKYLIDGQKIVICQSCAEKETIESKLSDKRSNNTLIINPLGYWEGGTGVDTGATNRKTGSDMGDSATGGGLHGKDLSKADVSVNIYAYLKAKETGKTVELTCAIGDESIDGRPYSEIVEVARDYIKGVGGFEKFAEWGLIRSECFIGVLRDILLCSVNLTI